MLNFNLIAIKLQLQRLANKKYLFLPLAVKSYTDFEKEQIPYYLRMGAVAVFCGGPVYGICTYP
jgi:hypothetical protein